MELFQYLRAGRWHVVFGYMLFTGMMATGYYYNITFIQLGLVDLGTRLIGMSEMAIAMHMALLALLTCITALLAGLVLQRSGRGRWLYTKLRLAWLVICVQTVLTWLAPGIRSEQVFLAWIIAAAITLGVGMPVTFSMTVDLIPVRDRGYVAAAITAAAYFIGAVFAAPWQIERFSAQLLGLMVLGSIGLGMLAFVRLPLIQHLARQQLLPGFGRGRFVELDTDGRVYLRRSLLGLVLLMFAIYFIDSLGFLRLIATPLYVDTAWQSPDLLPRLSIGGFHVLAAAIAGVLYTSMGEKPLFVWIFVLFALAQLMYVMDIRLAPLLPGSGPTLTMPVLYAMAVSLYTVVNFALWADISTPKTISLYSAIGVALSGWTATFISTALALQWRIDQMTLDRHLSLVAALALVCLLALLGLAFLRASRPTDRTGGRS